jgi:hypothetical protein
MHPKIKMILYGLGVFSIYAIFVVGMRYFSHYTPTEAEYFRFFSQNDLLLGLLVAVVMTFTHERKKRR